MTRNILVILLLANINHLTLNGRHMDIFYSQTLTPEKCKVSNDEAMSMGLQFTRAEKLPINMDSNWFYGATSTPSISSSETLTSKTPLWLTHLSSQETLSRNSHPHHTYSLCHALNQSDLSSRKTCCTMEMEWALLDRTVKQLQDSLSTYLARWSTQVSELRHALRDHIFRTLEVFHMQLNKTLCGTLVPRHTVTNCTQLSTELFPKFRLMIEQFLVGQGGANLDISIPIDNLIMQLLIDASCQSKRLLVGDAMENFDEEFKCHKYCQARLNLILDSLMTNSEQVLLSETEHFRGSTAQRLSESGRVHRRGTRVFDSTPDTHDRLLDVSQYKSLYSPELLFAIRLNRILMHSLEVAETLIEGLRERSGEESTQEVYYVGYLKRLRRSVTG
ncbi:Glypican [Paragonimus heterotremus]|uniref:Glypican n=1 Tax=Paragonimus heterotremus TaxID=100268 RepID=A0A8J4SRI5_9TREM|nr:Glypican [Paragonimus heterotremus]